MTRRALLLVNRKARQGRSDLKPIKTQLQNAGIELIEAPAHKARATTRIIRDHAGAIDLVIVAGGDGSINAAAEGILETQKPLGILPLGTANDLCRTLAIPLTPAEACEVITAGHTRRIDLGQVNNRYFFNVASLGLSVKVTRRLTRESKSRWGVFAYLFAAAGALIRARSIAIELRQGNESRKFKTVQLTVGNGGHYGGGMTVDEEARIDDGLLELFTIEVKHWWQVLWLLPAMIRGRLGHMSHANLVRGTQFEVRTLRSRRRWIMTDGEFATRTPAIFKVIPAALSVFVRGGAATDDVGDEYFQPLM